MFFDRKDDVKFTAAAVSYYGLAEWVNRHGVTENLDLSEDGLRDTVTLRYDQPEAMSARFGEGVTSIRFPWGIRARAGELALTHSPDVYLEYDSPLEYGEIIKHIKYIQDFITLCTDRAVATKEVTFYNRDIRVRMPDGSARGQQPIEYRASPVTSPTFAAKSRPQYSLDLGYDAVGGVETIATWIRIATEYAPTVNLMTSFRSEMKTYVENRFLNLAGAAETFHRLKNPETTQIPAAEWDHLREHILSAVPDGHREWVSNKLAYLNDPILVKRLKELAAEAKQITGGLSGNNSDKIGRWAGTIADVRNELTHRKNKDDAFPGGVLHWLSESVYQVLRVCLLKECIADDRVFDRLAAAQGPSELAAYVSAAITKAREIVRKRRER